MYNPKLNNAILYCYSNMGRHYIHMLSLGG